jgi:hypothetical protein
MAVGEGFFVNERDEGKSKIKSHRAEIKWFLSEKRTKKGRKDDKSFSLY